MLMGGINMSQCFVLLVSILSIVLGPTILWADAANEADFDRSGKVDFVEVVS